MNIGDISQGSSTSGADHLKHQRVERIATRDGNLKLGGEEGKDRHATRIVWLFLKPAEKH